MSAVRRVLSGRGGRAASAALVAGGVLASVGVAGAANDETILAQGTSEGNWDKPELTIQTGDTVTWSFAGTNTHNVVSTNTSATDPRWESFAYKGDYQLVTDGSSAPYTFYKAGTYTYLCQFHPAMTGTLTVEGTDLPIPTDPTPTPTPTPTATPTPPPTPTPQPGGNPPPPPAPDDHTSTPAPTPDADTTKPALSSIKLKGLRRGANVRFRLSEAATVTLEFRKRGSRKVLRSVRLQARAGTRTVRVRSSKLRKGRYTVTLSARDAMGNRSAAKRSALRIRR